jgi:hypothetical protein
MQLRIWLLKTITTQIRYQSMLLNFLFAYSFADLDPGSNAFLAPGSGMGKKIKILIQDEHTGSDLRELRNNFVG